MRIHNRDDRFSILVHKILGSFYIFRKTKNLITNLALCTRYLRYFFISMFESLAFYYWKDQTFRWKMQFCSMLWIVTTSAEDSDSESAIRCSTDPWIRIRDMFFLDPRSPTHISESLVTIFKVKNTLTFWQLAQIFSVRYLKKNSNNLQFCENYGCADQPYVLSWPMVISSDVNGFFVAV